jgi:hypothetical protein
MEIGRMARLVELMFCDPQSEAGELLRELTETLSDLQAWSEFSEVQKADLFGKLIGAKQAIDHCLRVNFEADSERTPKRLEHVFGAEGLSPWSLPSSRPPVIEGEFLSCVAQLLQADCGER